MSKLKTAVGDMLKLSKYTQYIYKKYKTKKIASDYKIDSMPIPQPVNENDEKLRINLVLPTLRRTRVFAGITTAIRFFKAIIDEYGCEARVIVMNEEVYDKNLTYIIEGFEYNRKAKRSIIYLNDDKKISVRKNDVFILTHWKTAYVFLPVIKWQKKEYLLSNRVGLYLIQDYEPGFEAWSTKYALAESTYSSNPDLIFAIFNSKELYDYFKKQGYSFKREIFFNPMLNKQLADILNKQCSKKQSRKKQIIIYGRPSEERNAFEIIRYALKLWSMNYKDARNWRLVSLGDWFDNIRLPNNTIEVHGKVSLDEYAEYMLTSYAGISLMLSPHPSYPPLEMSTFGVKTITNQFANKDLSTFNENIISLRNYTPESISRVLAELCDDYGKESNGIIRDDSYINADSFNQMVKNVEEVINEILSDG